MLTSRPASGEREKSDHQRERDHFYTQEGERNAESSKAPNHGLSLDFAGIKCEGNANSRVRVQVPLPQSCLRSETFLTVCCVPPPRGKVLRGSRKRR